jgi:two-component system, cell cycle response regulator DivK
MKTVLIVEDDPINARVFSKILTKRAGLAVKHTEDAEEVLQIAQDHAADIVLMDVSLSRSMYRGKAVDGIRLTQMLKADAATQWLPVILVTAHAMEGDRERFLAQSGADDYISKPVVDHEGFINQILALLPPTERTQADDGPTPVVALDAS